VPPEQTTTIDTDVRQTNVYAYGHAHLPAGATFTLGASGDFLRHDRLGERNQLNPKLGVTWSPVAGTTVRAAAFRVLKRTLVADQTLEPTQVAGFNQFFDDDEATRSWRYGLGVDQKFSRTVFAGVEGTWRELRVPTIVTVVEVTGDSTSVVRVVSWRERVARAYVFWTPDERLALRAEYFFEHLDRDGEDTRGALDATTHRVPLGIAYFLPFGLSASAAATFYDQSGTFGFSDFGFTTGADRFWILDAALTWRLPRRYGFVSVGATNLLDEGFRYFEDGGVGIVNPTVQPARAVFGRVTLAGP
jgi:hypothetical protein